MEELARPSAQAGQPEQDRSPLQGDAKTTPITPSEESPTGVSPDPVTEEAIRLAIINWELAGWWLYVTGRGVA